MPRLRCKFQFHIDNPNTELQNEYPGPRIYTEFDSNQSPAKNEYRLRKIIYRDTIITGQSKPFLKGYTFGLYPIGHR